MQTAKAKTIKYYLKWVLWVLLVQVVLANISASIYAYKFTHFYDTAPVRAVSQNVFGKTWKLFVGPKFYKNTNEPEPPFAYKNIELKTSGGIPIHAWYAPGTSATCVIFVHGYLGNKAFLTGEAAMIRQWGYSVLLFDLRGHGKSGGSTTSFGIKETEELEKAFAFAKQQGHTRIVVYGSSMGGGICVKAAHDGIIDPDGIISDAAFGSMHQHFKGRARMIGFPPEPFAALTTFWIGVEKGFNGFGHNIARYAKKVHCPALVQHGDHDPLVTKEETENIFNNFASKEKKLLRYPLADHGLFLDSDPVTWTKEVKAFLRSVESN